MTFNFLNTDWKALLKKLIKLEKIKDGVHLNLMYIKKLIYFQMFGVLEMFYYISFLAKNLIGIHLMKTLNNFFKQHFK
jgi:hypothetical protein